MINVCLENSDECKSFETIDKAINFLKNLKEFKVGDIVKVINTGKYYSHVTKEKLSEIYYKLNYDTLESLKIIYDINKNGMGYAQGVKEINRIYFKIVCVFDEDRKLLITPVRDSLIYHGYYIIDKEGVEKKCQEI